MRNSERPTPVEIKSIPMPTVGQFFGNMVLVIVGSLFIAGAFFVAVFVGGAAILLMLLKSCVS